MKMKDLKVEKAKEIAEELGMKVVVLILFEDMESECDEDSIHVISYGKDLENGRKGAFIANCIKKTVFGWPPELCNIKTPGEIAIEKIRRKAKEN